MSKIVFTGGGTGGHIYPGLAVAEEVKILCPEAKIVWIGSKNGRDETMVLSNVGKDGEKTCDSFIGIPSGKLRRYFSFQNLVDIFKIGFGFIAAFFILLRLKPQFVFSKGGFVSVPPCIAAKLLGIPVFTHECDFSPGLATKLNVRFAKKLLVSYEETKDFFPKDLYGKIIVTGNPVRDVFYHTDTQIGYKFLGLTQDDKAKKPILLILGGSLGAHQVNELVFNNLSWLLNRFIVVHQTGKGDDYTAACEKKIDGYMPFDFIYSEMPHVVACADIVLSRSGANSLWECAAAQKPMVLVPLAGSGTRGDQVENAAFFETKGAALVINSSEKDSEKLSESLQVALTKMQHGSKRDEMNLAIASFARENPAKIIARLVLGEI